MLNVRLRMTAREEDDTGRAATSSAFETMRRSWQRCAPEITAQPRGRSFVPSWIAGMLALRRTDPRQLPDELASL
jgi:hypothetical protein